MPSQKERSEMLLQTLKSLYQEQISEGTIDYVKSHSNNDVIVRGQVNTYLKYVDFVPKGKILDWGCLHAPDSCLLRKEFGQEVSLSGCDIYYVPGFQVFHKYAGLEFTPLEHHFRLPYPDNTFDAVIGSGVIEHVAMPRQSLLELHRILKKDGKLIMTYMPSRYSLTEFALRRLKMPHHRRRFTVPQVRDVLLEHGFVAQKIAFHEVTPTLSTAGLDRLRSSRLFQGVTSGIYATNPLWENFWPLNRLGQNIMAVATRVDCLI